MPSWLAARTARLVQPAHAPTTFIARLVRERPVAA
jgi:hypothetical protein